MVAREFRFKRTVNPDVGVYVHDRGRIYVRIGDEQGRTELFSLETAPQEAIDAVFEGLIDEWLLRDINVY